MSIIKLAVVSVVFGLSLNTNAQADELAKGKEVYLGMGGCSVCHGMQGGGDGVGGAALDPKPANFQVGVFKYDTDGDGKKGTEADVYNVITNGAAKYGGSMMMVARGDLPEADRKALAKYVISLKK